MNKPTEKQTNTRESSEIDSSESRVLFVLFLVATATCVAFVIDALRGFAR